MTKQRIKTLVLGQDDAVDTGRLFKNSSELTSNVKIESVASIPVYAMPLDAMAKRPCAGDHLDRHPLLA